MYNMQLSSFTFEMSAVHHVYSNPWYHDLYLDTTGVIRTLTALFRSGIMADKYNDDQNLLVDVENLDWYADRLNGVANKLDSYHTNLTDEEEVKTKVVDLFENAS
ncbi:MAG: hypothetical protein AABX72_04880 [Nanoarchaeota archaeon]